MQEQKVYFMLQSTHGVNQTMMALGNFLTQFHFSLALLPCPISIPNARLLSNDYVIANSLLYIYIFGVQCENDKRVMKFGYFIARVSIRCPTVYVCEYVTLW